jgi:hypothetical protein
MECSFATTKECARNTSSWVHRSHLTGHLLAMGELHRAGRQADGVQRVTGRPAMSVREFVSLHAEEFGGRRS